MMSFTSTTSARITNSEDKTTELVAARPTPAAPPWVRIPWKHAIRPIINPNTMVLNISWKKIAEIGALKSAINKLVEGERLNRSLRHPAHDQPRAIGHRVNKGSIRMQARMPVAASRR